MPIPNLDTIGEWSPTQLAKFISQTILVEPQILPNSLSLDTLTVAQDMDVGGNIVSGGIVQGVSGMATTVDTVLPGNPVHGQIHILRVGNTPYETITLFYDGLSRQWFSTTEWSAHQNDASFTTTSTSAVVAGATKMGQVTIQNGLDFWNAGLRPQTILSGQVTNSGNFATSCSVGMYQTNANDSSVTAVQTGVAAIGGGANGNTQYRFNNWETFTTAPTENHLIFLLNISVGGGTGTYNFVDFHIRWVSV